MVWPGDVFPRITTSASRCKTMPSDTRRSSSIWAAATPWKVTKIMRKSRCRGKYFIISEWFVVEFESLGLPVKKGSVLLPANRQARPLIGIFFSFLFINIHPQAGRFAGNHKAFVEAVGVRKYLFCLFGVRHMLLNTKIRD